MNWIIKTLNRWTGASALIAALQDGKRSLHELYEEIDGDATELLKEVALLKKQLSLRDGIINKQECELDHVRGQRNHYCQLTMTQQVEMEAARLTKRQLDEQAAAQLEMDAHRVDLEEELANAKAELAIMKHHLSAEKNTAATLNSQIYDLRRRVNIETDKANAWEKHYCEKRDECAELRKSFKKVVRTE
jgi:chromosome segregation ATPase